jgi:hypothetical protein
LISAAISVVAAGPTSVDRTAAPLSDEEISRKTQPAPVDGNPAKADETLPGRLKPHQAD